MKARITISRAEDGLLEVWVNEAGRDQLVRELQGLNSTSDHFHFGPKDMSEVDVGSIPYRPSDTVIEWGKVMLRPDDWDETYFPHVMPKAP